MSKLHAAVVLTALATFVPGGAVAQSVQTVTSTPIGQSLEYAAKFICGLPPGETGAFIGPVAAGFYFTSINVFNPNSTSVSINRRVLEVGGRTATGSETIDSLGAIKIDCFDVAQFFGQSSVTNSEGFVVLTVDKKTPLNVLAVYTSEKLS